MTTRRHANTGEVSAPWPEPKQAPTHLGTVEYRDIGDGPVLVFLHLVLAASDHWDKVVPLLSDRYRCIIPDLPMGAHRVPADEAADLTPTGLARAVADLLDHLDVDDVTVIGNHTGGALAQIMGADHPSRVGRLVLTDCDMYDDFPPKMFSSLSLAAALPGGVSMLARVLKVKRLWGLPMTFGWLTNNVDGEKINRWAEALAANPHVRRDAKAVLRGISPDYTNAAAEKLRTAGLPILLAWGANDKAFKLSLAERMRDEVPGAELTVIADCKAFVCWDQPDRLAHLIDNYITR